jgi:Lipase (class 3)
MTVAVVLPGAPDQKGMEPVHTCADELRALAGNDRTAKSDDYYALSSSVMAVRQDAFRYSVALACARLSRLVYDANDNICSELEATGAQVEFFRDTNKDLFGCVAIWQEHIVVTFRGTANMRNWRLNIRIMPHILSEYSDRVSVHSGFHDAYQAVSEQVLAILDRHMKVTPRKIYLTGHSLGGAMATIAAAHMSNRKVNSMQDYISACYTFASPRVGYRNFDDFVRVPLYRIMRGTDLVPAMPLRFYVPGLPRYYHGGDTRYFRSNVKHRVARRTPPSRIWNAVRGVWSLVAWLRSQRFSLLADHDMGGYVERVRAAKDEIDKVRDALPDDVPRADAIRR